METIEEKLDNVVKKLSDMERHLYNDERVGKDGTIKRVEKNEITLHDLKNRVETDAKIRKATSAVWGVVGTALAFLAKALITLIFKYVHV